MRSAKSIHGTMNITHPMYTLSTVPLLHNKIEITLDVISKLYRTLLVFVFVHRANTCTQSLRIFLNPLNVRGDVGAKFN